MVRKRKIRNEDYHRYPYISLGTRNSIKYCAKKTSPTNIIYVSSITIAELMIKTSIGKLQINFDPVDLAEQSGFELLNFTGKNALLVKDLPFHHRDPFAHMLVSQSIATKYPLMTDDEKIKSYDCKVI